VTLPLGALIAIDVAWVVGSSIAVGATAPHWPASWVGRDRFPVCRWPGESVRFYRRVGVVRLAARLPEGGSWLGGRSKSRLPGPTDIDLRAHLSELRRAEWVHWWSVALSLVLLVWNPWWLAAVFVLAATLGNLPFLVTLRNNRLRISAVIERRGRSA